MILHVRHVRAAGLCVRGLRIWCRNNNVDMRRLCDAGIPIEERPDLADEPFVQRALRVAEAEEQDDAS